MGVYKEILMIASKLNSFRIPTVVPEEENELVTHLSTEEFDNFKRQVSFQYLKKVRDPRTFAILAVNIDRHGISDYIGPNTFAEIAVAFAQSKSIYLLQGIPDAYSDELLSWRVIPLRGNLERLVNDYSEFCMVEHNQLSLL